MVGRVLSLKTSFNCDSLSAEDCSRCQKQLHATSDNVRYVKLMRKNDCFWASRKIHPEIRESG
jgi:hypothetical protein